MLKGRNIGRMDILLTIEQPTQTRNSINEDETTWTTYTQVFAERVWSRAGEKFEGDQEVGIDGVLFNTRYNSGIDNTMRLKQATESTYFYITNAYGTIEEGITTIRAIRRDNA